jgi:hypothetical protein
MSGVFATQRTRDMRSILARLDVVEAQQCLLARDLAEAEAAVASARERIEALEAERERTAPCQK